MEALASGGIAAAIARLTAEEIALAEIANLEDCLNDLVTANHILAHEGVVDGYGHVSIRHPHRSDRYFLSCSRSPELVTREDIVEFDLDSNPVTPDSRRFYAERPIHGEIYRARGDVQSVIHNHAESVIPFGTTGVPIRQMIHCAGGMGTDIPTWDIHDMFGDTDMLVRTNAHGADLARALADHSAVLMRGHGCTVVGQSLRATVKIAIYLMINARLQAAAMQMGSVRYMTPGEAAATKETEQSDLSLDRAWEYWAGRSRQKGDG